jgi:hypothetical protein
MARVKGVKEKLHSPIYDCFFVPGPDKANGKTFEQFMTDPRAIRFFVDVQNKTRLETNLQAAGVLPSLNFFEARAMRVVLSNVPLFIDREAIIRAGDSYLGYSKESAKEQKATAADKFVTAIEAECSRACAAAGSLLADLIYNSVTTLLVGEKIRFPGLCGSSAQTHSPDSPFTAAPKAAIRASWGVASGPGPNLLNAPVH